MAGDQVQEIKDKIDIAEIIGEHITLKKAGKNLKANCPFHTEKTPSFIVSPDIGRYKCFGCGKSGDVFTFLEEYDGMDFREALESLADRAGVALVRQHGSHNETKDLKELLSLLSQFYHYVLTSHSAGKQAREYLQKRNLSKETVETFCLGYSPPNQSVFTSFFINKKKISPRDLKRVGQVYVNGSRIKDRFSGRIMFPLNDHRGNTVGFSGRILPQYDTGQVGKYINTAETELYHKSHLLYGLDIVKDDIRKAKTAILVEGELDLLSLWQVGFRNTVAVKGTAITAEQSRILSRFADTVIFALDGDSAGDAAARRGIAIAEKEGLEVKVIQLTDYKDPDEAVQKDVDGFRSLVNSAVPAWDYLIGSAVKRFGTSGRGKALISRELVPILSSIEDNIVRAHYVGMVAKKLGVPHEAVYQEIRSKDMQSKPKKTIVRPVVEKKEVSRRGILEKRFLSLLFNSSSSSEITKGTIDLMENVAAKKILEKYSNNQGEVFDLKRFSDSLDPELQGVLGDIVLDESLFSDESSQSELVLVENELRILDTKEQLKLVSSEINKYEETSDIRKLASAKESFRELSERLSGLRQD